MHHLNYCSTKHRQRNKHELNNKQFSSETLNSLTIPVSADKESLGISELKQMTCNKWLNAFMHPILFVKSIFNK